MSRNRNTNSQPKDNAIESGETTETETVPATAYVQKPQYQRWVKEANDRNQSVSALISSMVEVGLNEIELEEESPSEIIELREQLRQEQAAREELSQELKAQEQGKYHIGLGRIKEVIIENPGIDRREIVNYVVENPTRFVDEYLENLEASEFINRDGEWYPPKGVGDTK